MQNLQVYQSLWGMELRSPHVPERTPEESFAMIAEAGFDGVCLDPAASETIAARVPALIEKHVLGGEPVAEWIVKSGA